MTDNLTWRNSEVGPFIHYTVLIGNDKQERNETRLKLIRTIIKKEAKLTQVMKEKQPK